MATTTHSFSVAGVTRGYYVYQRIWTPTVGEKATRVRELGNEYDRYATAVLEDQNLCRYTATSLILKIVHSSQHVIFYFVRHISNLA